MQTRSNCGGYNGLPHGRHLRRSILNSHGGNRRDRFKLDRSALLGGMAATSQAVQSSAETTWPTFSQTELAHRWIVDWPPCRSVAIITSRLAHSGQTMAPPTKRETRAGLSTRARVSSPIRLIAVSDVKSAVTAPGRALRNSPEGGRGWRLVARGCRPRSRPPGLSLAQRTAGFAQGWT